MTFSSASFERRASHGPWREGKWQIPDRSWPTREHSDGSDVPVLAHDSLSRSGPALVFPDILLFPRSQSQSPPRASETWVQVLSCVLPRIKGEHGSHLCGFRCSRAPASQARSPEFKPRSTSGRKCRGNRGPGGGRPVASCGGQDLVILGSALVNLAWPSPCQTCALFGVGLAGRLHGARGGLGADGCKETRVLSRSHGQ
jgi:hypothetical protein